MENVGEITYRCNLAGVKRVLPKLPKGTTFQIGFINNRVQSLWGKSSGEILVVAT